MPRVVVSTKAAGIRFGRRRKFLCNLFYAGGSKVQYGSAEIHPANAIQMTASLVFVVLQIVLVRLQNGELSSTATSCAQRGQP
jgi:hypothetical protein